MRGTGSDRRRVTTAVLALAAGVLLFALGLGLARSRLPEWRLGPLPARSDLARDFQRIAAQCGLRPRGPGPRFEVIESSPRRRFRQQVAITSAAPSAMVVIRGEQEAALANPVSAGQRLRVWFDATGRPQAVEWKLTSLAAPNAFLQRSGAPPPGLREAFAAALLAPGERFARTVPVFVAGIPVDLRDVAGATPAQHVTALAVGVDVEASRNPGSVAAAVASWGLLTSLSLPFETALGQVTLLLIAGAFCVLAIRRRVSLANAAVLAALAGLAVLPGVARQASAGQAAVAVLVLAAESAWLAVLWSAAESLWRGGDPRFDPTLDLLRAGRLTARAGRALLTGAGLGAAAAGLGLAAYALAAAPGGARREALSVDLPMLDGGDGPLAAGVITAAVIAFLVACGRRVSRRRWVPVAAALAGALLLSPVQLRPWPLALAGGALVAGALVAAGELGGLAALLAAALAYRLLPAAAFSALHLDWLSGGFVLAAGAVGILLLAGVVGILHPRGEEEQTARPPAFILRQERERRLAVEMDLLARMQLGLLPREVPVLPGWEIAARSLLADRAGGDLYDFVRDRAGRWWIAAGDVAGHGYSCAIAQAMVKAALAGLLEGGRTPAEVLGETDRVLRTAGAARSFTTLALLRLDPATGEALLANAGHPYPLLAEPGQAVREVALPGLPLGQGPPRRYADLPLALVPGATLALCSDGLFEAAAAGRRARAEPYGFDRPRAVLGELAGRPAAEVLDGLLADWRRHRGPGAPDDDTTVVVLRRH